MIKKLYRRKPKTVRYICKTCGCVSYAANQSTCHLHRKCSSCLEKKANKGKPSKFRSGWTNDRVKRSNGTIKMVARKVRDIQVA